MCQKGREQLKIYTHGILLISTTLFLKALVRRERAGGSEVHRKAHPTHPAPLETQAESWEGAGEHALFEMPGKTFWSGGARDFEAPIKLLA